LNSRSFDSRAIRGKPKQQLAPIDVSTIAASLTLRKLALAGGTELRRPLANLVAA